MTEQFTDDYFINLTMDYDKRDDSIYPQWAVWSALSEDRYYIDGKDGHFYTHVRTDTEIEIERKKRTILAFTNNQDVEVDEEGNPTETWRRYEMYLQDMAMDEEHVLDASPLTFEDWKKENISEEPVVEEPSEQEEKVEE